MGKEFPSTRSCSFSTLMARGEFSMILETSSRVNASSSSAGTRWLRMPSSLARSAEIGWAVKNSSFTMCMGIAPMKRMSPVVV